MSSYILFYSSNYTIWAENTLKDAGLACKMISVPRELSSDCGYCLQIEQKDIEIAKKILKNKNVPIDEIVSI